MDGRAGALLLDTGLDAIAAWDQGLVDRCVAGLDRDRWDLVSPAAGPARSTLVVIGGRDAEAAHGRLAAAGVDAALREGNVRLSPHLYNTADDEDRALAGFTG